MLMKQHASRLPVVIVHKQLAPHFSFRDADRTSVFTVNVRNEAHRKSLVG